MTRRSISILGILVAASFTVDVGTVRGQATWGPSLSMGTSAGSSRSDALTCPSGKYAIGIQAYAGAYIHMFKLECAILGPNGEHQSPELLSGLLGGGGNGAAYLRRCPSGKVMVGFRGRAGWWLDRIEVACKTWNRAGGGTQGSTTWMAGVGGTGGTVYGPILCPGQYSIHAVSGRSSSHIVHGWLVYSYNFSCKAAA